MADLLSQATQDLERAARAYIAMSSEKRIPEAH